MFISGVRRTAAPGGVTASSVKRLISVRVTYSISDPANEPLDWH